ncbi:MAG: lysoplasmalogenase [Sphaerochaeta sp.]|jgi:hypothetical protein|nr:lysoplasmalogenase [Sphaerochaeta sp.]
MNYQFLLFAMLCVIHICMRDMHREIPSRITKVLLMPSLLWYYLSLQTETGMLPVLVIVALALHTAGDLFLLFPKKLLLLSIGGLSFFVGHIFYISYFFHHFTHPVALLVVALLSIYPLVLAAKLVRKGPAPLLMFIYGLALVTEAMAAAGAGNWIALFGVIFFATSDSMLGYNTVTEKFSDVSIMATYTFAEFLLVVGILMAQGAV